MSRARSNTTLLALLPLLIAAAALVIAACQVGASQRNAAPAWVTWSDFRAQRDLDGDGRDEITRLHGGVLTIADERNALRYRSPGAWRVSDAFIAEIDEEPGPELLLVTWKRGSYGNAMPFWVHENDDEIGLHLFVFKYRDENLAPTWMSSVLDGDIRTVWLDDDSTLHLVDGDGIETLWAWDYWGFKQVEQPNGQRDVPGCVTFVAAGDNIVHDSLLAQMRIPGTTEFGFSPLYEHVAKRIRAADLAAVVQETPLIRDPSAYGGYPSFGTPFAVGDALAEAGFDVICAATNHACDRGERGMRETMAFWGGHPDVTLIGLHDDAGKAAGQPTIREANGVRIALVDVTAVMNDPEPSEKQLALLDTMDDWDAISKRLAAVREQADITVCFLHTGEEYAERPGDSQQADVEKLLDAGADVIVCSHSHVVYPAQRVTTARGSTGIVFWGLGNFASHQTDLRTIEGALATFTIESSGRPGERAIVTDYGLEPLVCHVEQETSAVYLLEDYTDELAAQHFAHTVGTPVTLEALCDQWETSLQANPK